MNVNHPNMKSHDDLFMNLSKLNVDDKLNATAIGNNSYKWSRNPSGLMQKVNRTGINAVQYAKESITATGTYLYNTGLDAAKGLLGATRDYLSGVPQQEKKLEIIQQPLIEEVIEKKPDVLADALKVATGINEELGAVSQDLEACKEFIAENDDLAELIQLKNDLKYLKMEMKASQTGINNLNSTYSGYLKSDEWVVYFQNAFKDKVKYDAAVKNLDAAKALLQENILSTEGLLRSIDEKIESFGEEGKEYIQNNDAANTMGINTTGNFNAAQVIDLRNAEALPPDFPENLVESKKNMHVAINQFLRNPIFANQEDDREIRCDKNGELSLQGETKERSTINDVNYFRDMVTKTYGSQTRDALDAVLKTNEWKSLTYGNIKLLIAMLPFVVGSYTASTMNGKEKCLDLLSQDERDYMEKNGINIKLVEYALTRMPDGQGHVKKIQNQEIYKDARKQALALSLAPTFKATLEEIFQRNSKTQQARPTFQPRHRVVRNSNNAASTQKSVERSNSNDQSVERNTNKAAAKQEPPKKSSAPKPQSISSNAVNLGNESEFKLEEEEEDEWVNAGLLTAEQLAAHNNKEPSSKDSQPKQTSSALKSSNIIDPNDVDESHSKITITEVKEPSEPKSIFQPTETMPDIKNYHFPSFLTEEQIEKDPNFKKIKAITTALKEKGKWTKAQAQFVDVAKDQKVKEVNSCYSALSSAWEKLEPLLKEKIEEDKKEEALRAQNEPQKSALDVEEPIKPKMPSGMPNPPSPPPVRKAGIPDAPSIDIFKAKPIQKPYVPRIIPQAPKLTPITIDNESLEAKFNSALDEYQAAEAALVGVLFPNHGDLTIIYPGLEDFKQGNKNAVSQEQLLHVLDTFKKDSELEHNNASRVKVAHKEKVESKLSYKEEEFLKQVNIKLNALEKTNKEFVNKNQEFATLEKDLQEAQDVYAKARNKRGNTLEAQKKLEPLQKKYVENAEKMLEELKKLDEKLNEQTAELQKLIGSEEQDVVRILSEARKATTQIGRGEWKDKIPEEFGTKLPAKKPLGGGAGGLRDNISQDQLQMPKLRAAQPRYINANPDKIKFEFYRHIMIDARKNKAELKKEVIDKNGKKHVLEDVVEAYHQVHIKGPDKTTENEWGSLLKLASLFEQHYQEGYDSHASPIFEQEFLFNTAISTKPADEFKAQADAYVKLHHDKKELSDDEQLAAQEFEERLAADAKNYAKERLNDKMPDVPWASKAPPKKN